MRTIIIISLVLVLPTILFAQQTYVPDDNFEQALIDNGYDTPPLNDSVPTANIEKVTGLGIANNNILDLTGIEDFTALLQLFCSGNNLTSLDVSNNTVLRSLGCELNSLTSLDLTNNSSLDWLNCSENNLISLDMSNNSALLILWCYNNNLTSLDIKNGNNKKMRDIQPGICFDARNNPNLSCIQVDDSSYSVNHKYWKKDDHAVYSEDCGYTGIDFQTEDGSDNISISSSPNPFSNSTTINYTIENPAMVRINVYDNLGQEITTLINEFKDVGEHQAQFNAENLPQGIYFYKIQIDNAIENGKLLLIR